MPRSSVITAVTAESAGSSPAFVPTDISSLELWFDADDASTITESSGSVSQWDDKSGNTRHASQALTGDQPITGTRTINSLNALDFRNGDRLETADFGGDLVQPIEIWAIVEWDTTAVGYITEGLDATHRYTTGLFSDLWVLSAGTFRQNTTSASTATVYGMRAYFEGSSSELWINGTSEIGPIDAGANQLNGLNIGGRYDDSNYVDGKIGEVLVFSSNLSAAEVSNMETYLSDKWGVTFA